MRSVPITYCRSKSPDPTGANPNPGFLRDVLNNCRRRRVDGIERVIRFDEYTR